MPRRRRPRSRRSSRDSASAAGGAGAPPDPPEACPPGDGAAGSEGGERGSGLLPLRERWPLDRLAVTDPGCGGRERAGELENVAALGRVNGVLKRRHMTEMPQTSIDELLAKAQKSDVCFVVDCTDGMAAYIREVRDKIKDMVDGIAQTHRFLEVRLAFVGYRDFCDGDDRLDVFDFDPDVNKFVEFVDGRRAFGGGDFAEDAFGGLFTASRLGWAAQNRILIHIADAPCHGDRFLPEGCGADEEGHRLDGRGRDRAGLSAGRVMRRLADRRLSWHFFHVVQGNTGKMLAEFSKIGAPVGLKMSEVDLKRTPDLLKDAVVSSVAASITETLQSMSLLDGTTQEGSLGGLEKARPDPSSDSQAAGHRQPDWEDIAEEQALEVWCEPPARLEGLCRGMHLMRKQRVMAIKVSPEPFAQGHMRLAHYAQDVSAPQHPELVMKKFRDGVASRSDYSKYEVQMEIQCVAGRLADLFNARLAEQGSHQRVEFLRVRAINMISRPEPFHANLEPLLKGKFVKFNSSCGYIGGLHDVLQAFSHWTHQATNGYLMVVDLQGLKGAEGYMLTDPAIHCKEVCRANGRYLFGTTNLGQKGMDAFFATHRCNSVCRSLGLPSPGPP